MIRKFLEDSGACASTMCQQADVQGRAPGDARIFNSCNTAESCLWGHIGGRNERLLLADSTHSFAVSV